MDKKKCIERSLNETCLSFICYEVTRSTTVFPSSTLNRLGVWPDPRDHRINGLWNKAAVDGYAVVQFYPWFKFYFPLFLGMVMYDNEFKKRGNKI